MIPAALFIFAFLTWLPPGPTQPLNVILFAATLSALAQAMLCRGQGTPAVSATFILLALHRSFAPELSNPDAAGFAFALLAGVALAWFPRARREVLLAPAAVAAVLRVAKSPTLTAFASPLHALAVLVSPLHPHAEAPWSAWAGVSIWVAAFAGAATARLPVAVGLAWFLAFSLFLPDAPMISVAGLAAAFIPLLQGGLLKIGSLPTLETPSRRA